MPHCRHVSIPGEFCTFLTECCTRRSRRVRCKWLNLNEKSDKRTLFSAADCLNFEQLVRFFL